MPQLGADVIDPHGNLTPPTGAERSLPITSTSPDISDVSVMNKDPPSIKNLSRDYVNVLNSMSALLLSPNG
jgi:hypothetical protein